MVDRIDNEMPAKAALSYSEAMSRADARATPVSPRMPSIHDAEADALAIEAHVHQAWLMQLLRRDGARPAVSGTDVKLLKVALDAVLQRAPVT
mgnify:CR=1 FL=1